MLEKSKTVKEMLAELQELIAWFEGDEFELEAAVDKFKRAEELSKVIDQELAEFKHKIDVVKKDFSATS